MQLAESVAKSKSNAVATITVLVMEDCHLTTAMFAVVDGGSSCGAMESVNTSISIAADISLTAD